MAFRMDKEKGQWFLSKTRKTQKASFSQLQIIQSCEIESTQKNSLGLKSSVRFPQYTASYQGQDYKEKMYSVKTEY